MKSFKSLLFIVVLLSSLSGFTQEGGKADITIKTNIYCDHCKQCESCGPRIYKQLMDTPGVRKVKIDEAKAEIDVTYNSDKVDATGIRNAINEAGFDADEQKASDEQVAQLDMCCRK